MPAKTTPILAKAIQATDRRLIVQTAEARYEIPWEACSAKLAKASQIERCRAVLSPSGYGIHWPLIDEDLAVGPLVAAFAPRR
jgi:hypothetical protein